jgi:hypothetical protein
MKAKRILLLASSGLLAVAGGISVHNTALSDASCYIVQPDGQVVLESMCSQEVYKSDSGEQHNNSQGSSKSSNASPDCRNAVNPNISRETREASEELERMYPKDEYEIKIVARYGDELVYESKAVETAIVSSEGIVSCRTSEDYFESP